VKIQVVCKINKKPPTMENISTLEVLSVIGLILVIVACYMRFKEIRKNRFIYYEATLYLTEVDFGGKLIIYSRTMPGKFIRHCQKTDVWQAKASQTHWKPLTKQQIDTVRKAIREGSAISLKL
jgi:beta-lactamase regulating signal transducer with metallopeptidase domain